MPNEIYDRESIMELEGGIANQLIRSISQAGGDMKPANQYMAGEYHKKIGMDPGDYLRKVIAGPDIGQDVYDAYVWAKEQNELLSRLTPDEAVDAFSKRGPEYRNVESTLTIPARGDQKEVPLSHYYPLKKQEPTTSIPAAAAKEEEPGILDGLIRMFSGGPNQRSNRNMTDNQQ